MPNRENIFDFADSFLQRLGIGSIPDHIRNLPLAVIKVADVLDSVRGRIVKLDNSLGVSEGLSQVGNMVNSIDNYTGFTRRLSSMIETITTSEDLNDSASLPDVPHRKRDLG